jgi:hypothetical protein
MTRGRGWVDVIGRPLVVVATDLVMEVIAGREIVPVVSCKRRSAACGSRRYGGANACRGR